MYFIKNGKIIARRISKDITTETLFTILSFFSSDIPFLIRFTSEPIASLNKKPPSSGIIGRTLNNPTARLSQKIQYNAVTKPQKTLGGSTLKGPVNTYESVNGGAIGL